MIEIDELSNEVMTDAEISNRVAAMIESAYSPGSELKIMRRYLANPADVASKAAFDAYNADVEAIRTAGRIAKIKVGVVRESIAVERGEILLTEASAEAVALFTKRKAVKAAVDMRELDIVF